MIERLRLQKIRSWTSLDAAFGSGPQILWGANGAGKTTVVEALLVAATGRSHRAAPLREIVQEGADVGLIGVGVRDVDAGADDPLAHSVLTVEIGREERTKYNVNGTARRSEALGERLKVAAFVPEETGLVVGAPAIRRAALDRIAIQWSPGYRAALTRYERSLKQRNRLLKDALERDGAVAVRRHVGAADAVHGEACRLQRRFQFAQRLLAGAQHHRVAGYAARVAVVAAGGDMQALGGDALVVHPGHHRHAVRMELGPEIGRAHV